MVKEVEVVKEVEAPQSDARYGCELKVALGAAISTLDVHRTTGTTANEIAYAVQEFLFAYDENMIAQPLLETGRAHV